MKEVEFVSLGLMVVQLELPSAFIIPATKSDKSSNTVPDGSALYSSSILLEMHGGPNIGPYGLENMKDLFIKF